MRFNTDYRLNRHHKFKQNDRKYVADLETNAIVEVNGVEWDILQRYGTQTQYQIVEAVNVPKPKDLGPVAKSNNCFAFCRFPVSRASFLFLVS